MICFQIVFKLDCSSLGSFPLALCEGLGAEPLRGVGMPKTPLMLLSCALGVHPISEPLLRVSSNSPWVGDNGCVGLNSIEVPSVAEFERESGGEDALTGSGGGDEKKEETKEYSAVPLSRRTSIRDRMRASWGSFWNPVDAVSTPALGTQNQAAYVRLVVRHISKNRTRTIYSCVLQTVNVHLGFRATISCSSHDSIRFLDRSSLQSVS